MAKRSHKQSVARQGNQQVVHASYEEDDNMLPSPEVLEHYQSLDPKFIEWFMRRADVEQNGRIKFNNDRLAVATDTNRKFFQIDILSIITSVIVITAFMAFSYLIILEGHVYTGSILGGTAVVIYSIRLLGFRRNKTGSDKKD